MLAFETMDSAISQMIVEYLQSKRRMLNVDINNNLLNTIFWTFKFLML